MNILVFLILFIVPNILHSQWIQQRNYIPKMNTGRTIDASDKNSAAFYSTLISGEQGFYMTLDGGQTWNPRIIPEGFVSDICMINRDTLWYCTTSASMYLSTDGGLNWEKQNISSYGLGYIEVFDKFYGVAAGEGNSANQLSIFRTASLGVGWNRISNPTNLVFVDWRTIDFVDYNTGYFYSNTNKQKLYKSTDGGTNWVQTNFPEVSAQLIKFYNKDIGIACGADWDRKKFIIYRTFDGGNFWETISTNMPGTVMSDIEYLPENPNFIWFLSYNDLFFSKNGGVDWSKHELSNGNLMGRDIVFADEQNGWILCDDGIIYYTANNGGIVTDVNYLPSSIPDNYNLYQNYPNPFNPATVISYSLPREGFVSLRVYDILGNEVAELANEQKSAGTYRVDFNADNLSSGVYFYRIKIDGFAQAKKMIIQK
ncbi:MAG: T9SS type A sorting domain-containing protein [Ignavibacteriaceae bacterium]|jgi:photosystem II stability/assembly factor-like uncharacterized protein|nr:MAG: hypothetical protein APF79_03355 [bacterium BRH_c32]MDX9923268.1 T9SS type A sorting domain-containing protein [Ignavibacteriaceae bacterium]